MFYAAFIYIMAVISPGPNFILVSRYSALGSIKLGLGVVLGICLIGACFSTLSLLGLVSVIHLIPNFAKVSVILGSLYLAYIAFVILYSTLNVTKGTTNPNITIENNFTKAFRVGAITNILNMKTIAFMVSIYSGFLAVPRSALEQVVIVLVCSSLEFLWYFLVILIFSKPSVKGVFYRYRILIDRSIASFLILFAIQNIYTLTSS